MSIYDDKPRKGKTAYGAKRKVTIKGASGHVGYADVEGIARLVERVAEGGDRISFGYTSGGGVISVTLLSGPPPYETFYARDEAEWEALRDGILSSYVEGSAGEAFA